jgi:hypothetical protein
MRFRRSALFFSLVVCCFALICLPGCGKKKAVVKGKISFMKQPLTAGTIAFVDAGGRSGSGIIKSTGEYVVNDAPVGDVTVTVTTPPAPRGPAGMMKPPPGTSMPKEMLPPGYEESKAVRPVPVPEKYGKVETSTLKYTVQPGSQDKDFDLTP